MLVIDFENILCNISVRESLYYKSIKSDTINLPWIRINAHFD